jgi:SAM-dependent methyltransferase
MAFLDPVPNASQLPDLGDWWSDQKKFISRNREFKMARARVQNLLFGTAQERLIRQTRRLVSGGELLDVGCGNGELMEFARPYFQCEGLDCSEIAAERSRERGFRVISSTLEEAEIPDLRYDVVTMDAVLEHLLDPVLTLVRINRMLRMGGVVVIKVPKLWGPTHRLRGREWNGFRVGYHTIMFTGATLDHALHLAGFAPVPSPRRDRPLDDILMIWGRKVTSLPNDPEALNRELARRVA